MKTRYLVLGGLLAVALTVGTANTASAQFGPGFVPSYQQSTFVTPSGGVVNSQSTYNPLIGQSTYNKTYVNPYTGVMKQRSYVAGPGYAYGSNYGYAPNWANTYVPPQPLPVGLAPGFATSAYYNTQPAFTPVWGYRPNYVNPYAFRPNFGITLNFGR